VEVNAAASGYLAWAARTHEPFFLFLNYMDAHAPYLPRPPFDERYPGRDPAFRWDKQYGRLIDEVMSGVRPISDRERAHLESQYDGSIAYLDHHLGRLFDRLKALGLYDDALIIVTSDHGEAFGEHGFVGHGAYLYENQLRVPLIVKYPRSRQATVTDTLVSSVDLLPTILDVIGSPVRNGLDGRSLRGIERVAGRWVSAESYAADAKGRVTRDGSPVEVAVYCGNLKLIRDGSGARQFYDLAADRGESAGVRDSRATSPEWNQRLAVLASRHESPTVNSPIDAETRERLRALGYLK
jgi:arylsulfatase A-like enzyme